jgi:hypothetical protein
VHAAVASIRNQVIIERLCLDAQASDKTKLLYHELLKAVKQSDSFGIKIEKPLGNDLLSQEVALQVPSALTALTTGFGM